MKLEQKVHVREITVVKLGDRTLTHSGNSEDAVARSAGTRRPSDPGCSHREIWDKHLVLRCSAGTSFAQLLWRLEDDIGEVKECVQGHTANGRDKQWSRAADSESFALNPSL